MELVPFEEPTPPKEHYGGWVANRFSTPLSDGYERMEHLLAGVDLDENNVPQFVDKTPNTERIDFEASLIESPPREISLRASSYDDPVTLHGATATAQIGIGYAQVIPQDVLAAYRLCEYYWTVEGDVRQTIETPMDLAVRPLTFAHKDKGVVRTFTELYGPNYLDMDTVIPDMWLSLELYGSAYPMEIWSLRVPDRLRLNAMCRGELTPLVSHPQQITCLNPKYIYVGKQPFSGSNSLMLSPTDNATKEFRQQILDLRVPPMSYNALSYDIHEYLVWSWNIPLDNNCVTQLRDKANNFIRYPWPSLMSCFRTISTRQVLEEMVRATIEGTKNQLWAFLLGNEDKPATAQEIQALQNTVAGLAGLRTGHIVWRGNLRVEIYAPVVDSLMSNDKWTLLTDHLYRQRGISKKVVAGDSEQPVGSDDVDVKVLIERLKYKRNQIQKWLDAFTRKVAILSGDPALIKLARDGDLPRIKMSDFGINVQDQIKNQITPLYQAGLLSPQTALQQAGYDHDQELANQLSANKEAFQPPPTFAQTSTNAQGDTKTATSQRTGNKPHGEDRIAAPRARRTGTGGVRGKAT